MKSLFLSVLTLLSLLIPRIVLGDTTAIDWSTQPNHLKLSPGKSLTVACPANGKISSRLWGTDIYTDDSSICTAAVHAGLIQAAIGGTVQVEGLAGQPGYRGSQRNGVGSRDYGGWTGSFAVAKAPAVIVLPPPPGGGARVDASPDATVIDWGTQANTLRLAPGKSMLVTCPANGQISSRLWGTDIYTDDSSICTAAVHTGLIKAGVGGTVRVDGLAGQPTYRGSQRNGVGSRDYGGWTGSFAIRPVGFVPPPPPGVNKSLTGAWVHSADGTTQTPDSKVIVLHEGSQVTLVATYKMEVNRNQWQTYRCVGQLNGNELPVQCRWIEGGNPMSYGDANWTMNFQVTPDRDHLNYKHTKPGPGQDAYYSRVP